MTENWPHHHYPKETLAEYQAGQRRDLLARLSWSYPGCDPVAHMKTQAWAADVTKWYSLGFPKVR